MTESEADYALAYEAGHEFVEDAVVEADAATRERERERIVVYLRREADSWHASWERGGTKKQRDLAWRNYAAYSAAAYKVEHLAHQEPPDEENDGDRH